jgi:MoxR-like ATPase
MKLADILEAREVVRQIFVDDKVKGYVVDIVHATREPKTKGLERIAALIENGASPRASINLVKLAKAQALLQGRSYVTPHDVKSVAPDVLRHRLLLSYEAEAEDKTADDVVRAILDGVLVP